MKATLIGALLASPTILASVLLPAHAQAATTHNWDRVAECESGGNWGINTGNGYYGGLQFAKRTWDGHDGQEFAAWPHQATKEEQILVAERVLGTQGVGAWPVCGQYLSEGQSSPSQPQGVPPEPEVVPPPEPLPAPMPDPLGHPFCDAIPAELRGAFVPLCQ